MGASIDTVFKITFNWLLPLSINTGLFLMVLRILHRRYEKFDVDRLIKFLLKFIFLGAILIAVYYLISRPGNPIYELIQLIKRGLNNLLKLNQIEQMSNTGKALNIWQQIVIFISWWSPIYTRAFLLIFSIGIVIEVQSLLWRISFFRAANIMISTMLCFPYLIFKYLLGYQTPVFDFVQSRFYVARLKENLNDSYFDALQGYDERGNKFENGAGGTVQKQRIKKTALMVRQTKAFIKTANGNRHAELITRNSNETDTDKMIETSLKGLGQRLPAPSIRFQDDPVLDVKRGGYIFDSDVDYRPGDELGSWHAIFVNPFSYANQIAAGGQGAYKIFKNMFLEVIRYVRQLTPPAIYEKIVGYFNKKYAMDKTLNKAKYVVQQNLDLDAIPEPVDPDTGNNIDTQRENALKVANERINDVTNALNAYKLSGTFKSVIVGGNTAVYQYTLPREANLPTDFDRVQNGIANMLKTPNIPIITVVAGILNVSVVNGVNIPVDFRDMIKKRRKGVGAVVSGLIGVDAEGNNIEFELNQKNMPHAMLFGKTGTGKTVTIMTILFSIMAGTDPEHLKIAYIDGKGNSFEFMRTDNADEPGYHPNPFTYAQPADASGDIDYARGLIKHLVKEVRSRIDLFKKEKISNIDGYNEKHPEGIMYEILAVIDEFSAITDLDKLLKASELAEKGTVDNFEYLAKMARSVGIHLLMANQTARKEKVPGVISANIPGRISLGVSEPIESDIALPDSGIAVHLISQAGEFYSALKGVRNVEHGNSPYLLDKVMYALNDSLERKFGHRDYVVTREEIMQEMDGSTMLGKEATNYAYTVPPKLPDEGTPVVDLVELIHDFPEWALANQTSRIFTENQEFYSGKTPAQVNKLKKKIQTAMETAKEQMSAAAANTHKSTGALVSKIMHGNDKGVI
jgi:DNA polymerase III delta prime subunit